MIRRALQRHVVAIWLALMLLAGLIAARANYVADLSAFLPTTPTAEQRVLLEQLKHGVTTRVMLIGIRGGDPLARAEASRELAASLRASGEFDSVNNGDREAWKTAGDFIFSHRYLLSPAVDAQRFTIEGLNAAIGDTVSLLGTPAGSLVKPLIWRDPTGEALRVGESMMPTVAPRVEEGVWVSRSAPRAVLVATTHADGSDLDAQARAIERVKQSFAPLAARGLELELSGAGVLSVQSRAYIESEVRRLGAIDTVALVALLLLAFGALRAVGVALLPVASGVLAGIAAVALYFGEVHGVTLAFGTTLIGEAVDYSIYYLVQARQGHQRWLSQNWRTVRLGLWTSLAGFTALAFSGFDGLAQLGVYSIAGLIAAALTTRFLLRRLAPDGAPGMGLRRHLGRGTARAAAWLPRLRWPLGLLTLVALGFVLLQPSPWRGSLAALSPVSPEAIALDASLRQDVGAPDGGALVAIEAPDEGTALERAEQLAARLDALVDQGLLLGYESPAKLLPSQRTQAARQAALPDDKTLRERLARATEGGPLAASRLEPFVADVQAQRRLPLVTRESLAGTPLASAVQAQLLEGRDGRPWTVLVSLHLAGDAAGKGAMQRVQASLADLPQARLVQIQPELDAMYAGYLHQGLVQALLGGTLVVLLLYAHLRSLRRLLRIGAPLAASIVLVLAGLTLAGVALGVLHLVGFLLVAAVGSNYALFFDHLRVSGQADDDTLASLLLANLTTVATFGLLATSNVPALASIGQVVGPGALLCLLLSACFVGRRKAWTSPGLVGKSPA